MPRLKLNLMELTVTVKKGSIPGPEITVFYGRYYFGENQVECQFPFFVYHGSIGWIFESRTRSGRQPALLFSYSPDHLEVS